MYNKTEVIAEVKTRSPFGYTSEKTWGELFQLADTIGDVISVHTDSRWGGSFELIKKARGLTKKPILAKGIHGDDSLVRQAVAAGADFVLVVGRIPAIHVEKCWIEPTTLSELEAVPPHFRVLWNSRDLADGRLKKETFEEARALRVGWLCQASNIKTRADIKEGADAVLVGTHLFEFAVSLRE